METGQKLYPRMWKQLGVGFLVAAFHGACTEGNQNEQRATKRGGVSLMKVKK